MSETHLLGYEETWLEAQGGAWTAREIVQQPDMLRRTQALLRAQQGAIEAFLQPLLARPDLRIVLTGAGTSAFIGDSLAPWLAGHLKRRVEAVATTDIACAPELYLDATVPTLLVSFGRSGNSPESIAAVELADQCLGEVHHLIITCNADGALAKYTGVTRHGYCVLLPEDTHDRGFAMTSSYSSMTLAALSCLSGISAMEARIEPIARAVADVIICDAAALKAAAEGGYDRVAYLGSHIFKGVAREAALKLMELTNGGIATVFDSTLGFRHGPKTFITGKTLVFVFLSNDAYTRRYDLDLLGELRGDGEAGRIIAVTAQDDMERSADPSIGDMRISEMRQAADIDLIFPYITVAQIFAFHQSLRHGLTPDRPNAKGTVNRVVQGVRIHERV
jgi:tagatose-6-phosphate ketose/aldose isomerase